MDATELIASKVEERKAITDYHLTTKRPCLNELQKEYCVKTKVKALD